MPKPRIIHGNSNPELAAAVAKALGTEVLSAKVGSFPNGEIEIKIHDNIRGEDVFVLQPTCANGSGINVNRSVMELLLLIHTLKLASARRITAVIPHYGYARQDRKTQSRVPISASAVAKMITELGVDAVMTIDLHCGQIQGFFHGCPMNDLNPAVEFANYARTQHPDPSRVVVVAPDAGAVGRAKALADQIGASHIVTILKRRVEAGKVDTMQLVGEVQGHVCIIVDDMIDTAGTLCKAAEVLVQYGATEVHAYASHGILTDPACDRINASTALVEVVVTDSLPVRKLTERCPKLKVISVAPLLAEAILRSHTGESMEHVRQQEPAMQDSTDAETLKFAAREDEADDFPK